MRLDPSTEGVVVLDITRGSPAQRLGFQRGDVVLMINETKVDTSKELEKVTRDFNRSWEITILRNGRQVTAQFGG